MKKKLVKYSCAILGSSILILTMTGCGKVTSDSLLKSMSQNMSKEENYKMDMLMDLKASGTVQGMSVDINMNMDMGMKINTNPEIAHAEGNMTMEMLGMNQSSPLEVYTVKEGDNTISYSKTGEEGWTKEVQADLNKNLNAYDFKEFEKLAANLELEKNTTDLEGIECYALKGVLDGEALSTILDSTLSAMNDSAEIMGDVNWAEIKIPVEFYIAKKGSMPVKMSLDMQSMMLEVMKSAGAQEEVEFACDKCTFDLKFGSFGEVETITLPDDVKNAAVEKATDSAA